MSISFYLRLLRRQWRSGVLRLLCVAITIASAAIFSVSLISDRLDRLFQQQSNEILAADLVLKSSSSPITGQQQQLLANYPTLRQAQMMNFGTMISVQDRTLLGTVKAVTENYPLRGKLQLSDELYGLPQEVTGAPLPGEVWAEERVLHELNIGIGDYLRIGSRSFLLARVLVFEPDRGDNFYSFVPRVMMNRDDIASTGILRPGSRVTYRYLFAGEGAEIQALREELQQGLQPNQKFITIEQASRTLSTNLEKAYGFLRIATLIAVLFGAIATALVSFQYAREMTPQYVLLRCLGLYGRRLYLAIVLPFLLCTLLSVVAGITTGAVIHWFILQSLAQFLPADLPAAGMMPLLLSFATVVTVLLAFALPFLSVLSRVQYRQLVTAAQSRQHNLPLRIGIILFIGLVILIQLATRDIFISGVVTVLLLLCGGGMYWGVCRLLSFLATRRVTNIILRLSLRLLAANRAMIAMQVTALAMSIFALGLVYTLRDDLLQSWQAKIPADAANFFAFNLFAEDEERFKRVLADLSFSHSPFYPIIRGRLSAVNGESIQTYAGAGSGRDHEGLRRDLSLTWGTEIPYENEIVAGVWHGDTVPENPVVSMEEKMAEALDISVGDRLEFTINTETLEVPVGSIRSLRWESFTPNFYMVFDPRALADFSHTLLASMHVSKEQRFRLPTLTRQFPEVTFFDVDFLLQRVRYISTQVSRAIQLVLLFSVIASIMVFCAIELILHRDRCLSSAILKALGCYAHQVQRIFLLQLLLGGIMAGGLAWLLNMLIIFVVSQWYIGGTLVINWGVFVLCWVITPLLSYVSGYFSLRGFSRISGKSLLQRV